MYGKPGAPAKQAILEARDRILDRNPNLRMVGAHLGSMEGNFDELGQHLEKYPNFAVDMAARIAFFEMQPRAMMIAFTTKYQDRLIYGTDNEFYPSSSSTAQDWEDSRRSGSVVANFAQSRQTGSKCGRRGSGHVRGQEPSTSHHEGSGLQFSNCAAVRTKQNDSRRFARGESSKRPSKRKADSSPPNVRGGFWNNKQVIL